jgi:hypothetical protein
LGWWLNRQARVTLLSSDLQLPGELGVVRRVRSPADAVPGELLLFRDQALAAVSSNRADTGHQRPDCPAHLLKAGHHPVPILHSGNTRSDAVLMALGLNVPIGN